MDDYAEYDATGLAELIAAGTVSALEVTEAAIAAIERVDPTLEVMVHRAYDEARAKASGDLPDGPFRGVPVLMKDLSAPVAGWPYTAGSRFLADHIAGVDAEVTVRLRKAGVVMLGTTKSPELGILGVTEPELHGPARNPWNPDHTPAGSSGGSGAIVGARAVPAAHGGDGGGSLRLPGSANGILGLKCTRGRIPMGPALGEGWGGFVQPGMMVRTVRDLAGFIDVLAGPMLGDPYAAPPLARPLVQEVGVSPGKLRIAYTGEALFGSTTSPDALAALESTVALLRDLGHEVVEAKPAFDRERLVRTYLVQVAACTAATIEALSEQEGRTPRPEDFEQVTWFLNQVGRALPAFELQRARDAHQDAGRAVSAFLVDHDVFLTPTMAHPPVRVGELGLQPYERAGLSALRAVPSKRVLGKVMEILAPNALDKTPNTQLFNQTGHPAMSMPLHWTDAGLPMGTQFVARFGDEATLIRLASQIEAARPWLQRMPQVHA
jgi:amidase